MYLVSSGFSFKPTSSSSSSSSTQFSQGWARRKVVVKHSIKSKLNQLFLTSVPWDDTITQQLHNDYSHSTGSMYMAWVSASSCHPFKGEISRDKSNYLTVSYSLRNIERRVIWFEGVLLIDKYQNTIQMIWMCHNPCEISKDGSDDLTVSSSLQAGRRNWYASSLY